MVVPNQPANPADSLRHFIVIPRPRRQGRCAPRARGVQSGSNMVRTDRSSVSSGSRIHFEPLAAPGIFGTERLASWNST